MNANQQEIVKKQFLESLTKTFTIAAASHAVGIDRKTAYRWFETDPDFKQEVYETIHEGKKYVTDIATTQLIKHINDSNLPAITYWLNHHDPNMNDKTIQLSDEEIAELFKLINDPITFKQGYELITSHVLKGKISEKQSMFMLRVFSIQMQIDDLIVRKKEAETSSIVFHRKTIKKRKY